MYASAYSVTIGSGFFRIGVDLTEKGLEQYEEVVKVIFQYINMLKREGVKKWIFDEVSRKLLKGMLKRVSVCYFDIGHSNQLPLNTVRTTSRNSVSLYG